MGTFQRDGILSHHRVVADKGSSNVWPVFCNTEATGLLWLIVVAAPSQDKNIKILFYLATIAS